MLREAPRTLDALPAPDEIACRHLLALLAPLGVSADADAEAA